MATLYNHFMGIYLNEAKFLIADAPFMAHGERGPKSNIYPAVAIGSGLAHMDSTSGQSLYPLHRTKTIHLVRHAQGIHNVEGEKDYNAYLSEALLMLALPLSVGSRTMQTAVGVFGGEGYADGIEAPPLMVANAGESNRPAISSLNCPPFVAVELCRNIWEFIHVTGEEVLTSIGLYFLQLIFHWQIENDADILWTADVREENDVAARGQKFLSWLWTRKEKEIAVVTHSGFLYHTLSAFGNDCHPSVKCEICTHFNNCELRSVVVIDRSMMGSDPATTNYPGKIPAGLDLPSDVAQEKHPEMGVSN
ncbi:hypothetical protein GH714_003726 [Hevea brasiliensis]|uniref:Phosphoglycerate mutase-like protein n=1 Tax=Hevea brasiliensis TaxID=3981 RepID=A0A6A6NFI3_HEVBR|nr:hypothetical protein GH714_003726 [Hevea brasiliensis]